MTTCRIGSRTGGGVNLDERNLRARHLEVPQAQGVLFDFKLRGFLSVERWKQALNDDGMLARDEKDVCQDFFQRNVSLVHLVQIFLSAAIELGPDFIGLGE